MTEDLEALRRHGFGLAYRMLGTVADAEDVVQEALAPASAASTEHRRLSRAAWP